MTPPIEHAATLAEMIERRARLGPDVAVLRAPGRDPLSAAGLLTLVEGLRTVLRDRGVGPAGRVALLTRNGPEAAAAFLGIASSAACAPLNTAYTRAELEFALSDLHADAVAVQGGIETPARELAVELGLPLLELISEPDAPCGTLRVNGIGAVGTTADDVHAAAAVSLLLHTSGTTARPKLVPLTQRNLMASARNVASTLGLAPDDVCLNTMPLFHIHGLVAALLASVWSGGSVCCAPGFDAHRFPQWSREAGATWSTAVPTIHQTLLARLEEEPGSARGHPFQVPALVVGSPPRTGVGRARRCTRNPCRRGVRHDRGCPSDVEQPTPARAAPARIGRPGGRAGRDRPRPGRERGRAWRGGRGGDQGRERVRGLRVESGGERGVVHRGMVPHRRRGMARRLRLPAPQRSAEGADQSRRREDLAARSRLRAPRASGSCERCDVRSSGRSRG